MPSKNSPIGIFDSGIGGFTVVREVHSLMPYEEIIYFGDTARVPYGPKSKETVIRYSEEILAFLLSQDVKYVVIACNTASSHSLTTLRKKTDIPIMGVIEPGVNALIQKVGDRRVAALVATSGTIKSRAYEQTLQRKQINIKIHSKACPLFVPLVEENLINHKITKEAILFYLDEFHKSKIEHLILGCTHYPLLKNTITKVYPNFNLIDSSKEASLALKAELIKQDLLTNRTEGREIKIYVSDLIENFTANKSLFLKEANYSLETIDLSHRI